MACCLKVAETEHFAIIAAGKPLDSFNRSFLAKKVRCLSLVKHQSLLSSSTTEQMQVFQPIIAYLQLRRNECPSSGLFITLV